MDHPPADNVYLFFLNFLVILIEKNDYKNTACFQALVDFIPAKFFNQNKLSREPFPENMMDKRLKNKWKKEEFEQFKYMFHLKFSIEINQAYVFTSSPTRYFVHLFKDPSSFRHLKYIIENKPEVDVNVCDEPNHTSVLQYYCQRGDLPHVQFLLQVGRADLYQRDRYGSQALHYAVCHPHPEERLKIVLYLIEQGSNMHQNDNYHSSPYLLTQTNLARAIEKKDSRDQASYQAILDQTSALGVKRIKSS